MKRKGADVNGKTPTTTAKKQKYNTEKFSKWFTQPSQEPLPAGRRFDLRLVLDGLMPDAALRLLYFDVAKPHLFDRFVTAFPEKWKKARMELLDHPDAETMLVRELLPEKLPRRLWDLCLFPSLRPSLIPFVFRTANHKRLRQFFGDDLLVHKRTTYNQNVELFWKTADSEAAFLAENFHCDVKVDTWTSEKPKDVENEIWTLIPAAVEQKLVVYAKHEHLHDNTLEFAPQRVTCDSCKESPNDHVHVRWTASHDLEDKSESPDSESDDGNDEVLKQIYSLDLQDLRLRCAQKKGLKLSLLQLTEDQLALVIDDMNFVTAQKLWETVDKIKVTEDEEYHNDAGDSLAKVMLDACLPLVCIQICAEYLGGANF